MKILSRTKDNRINSWNLFLDITIEEYLSFAELIIKNNDFQRKRVRTSKSVYALLKKDIQTGCVIPPLVLASLEDLNQEPENISDTELYGYIQENFEKVIILDGLQRTYTIIDAAKELKETDEEKYKTFCKNTLKIEFYTEINRFGILYRMLTLNTGQTPMSMRHQLEMLYNNYLDIEIDGVKLIKDTDGAVRPSEREFKFQNVIEGFNAYITRSELPIDRMDLLDNIKMLENISEEDTKNDLFKTFLECYALLFNSLCSITEDRELNEEEIEISGSPFGKKTSSIFASSQAFTGFGSAIGKLKEFDITDLDKLHEEINDLPGKNNGDEWQIVLIENLDNIRNKSKKIGNAQRTYFHYFFRDLFNKEGDSYLNLQNAAQSGYKKYVIQIT